MQFFSDEYLMHYGIKGMKWKKHKKPEDKTPAEYYNEAVDEVNGVPKIGIRIFRKMGAYKEGSPVDGHRTDSEVARAFKRRLSEGHVDDPRITAAMRDHVQTYRKAQKLADSHRNADLKKARKEAYKKNQKRIAKQQRKAKVKNTLKRVKNKIFVDTSGSKKIGKHLYVDHN